MIKRMSLIVLAAMGVAARAGEVDPVLINNRMAYWDHIFEWAYPLYYFLFALGAIMVIASIIIRRVPEWNEARTARGGIQAAAADIRTAHWIRETLLHLGLALMFFLCAISQQTCIDTNRGFIADQEKRYEDTLAKLAKTQDKEELLRAEYLYLPVGDSLAYITLGNTGLAADYLWLTSMQYVHSSFRRGHKFELLQRLFTAMVDMDPHWVEAQTNAGKILSALEPDRFAVERFYIRCVRENPDDWHLPYGAGYLFIVPPLNLDKDQEEYARHAVGWLDDALKQPAFPAELRTFATGLKARLAGEANSFSFYMEADHILFQQATDPHASEEMRSVAARDWLNAHSIVMTIGLQEFVDAFFIEHGVYPRSLRQLFREHWEAAERYETDAFGFEFEYDAQTGKVASRGVNVRKALTMESVIIPLIGIYRGAHEDKPPGNLKQLGEWIREFYSSPGNQPSAGVQQALGSDLDPTRCPLGQWNYDAVNGKIILPEWCNGTRLYQNVESVIHLRDR